MNSLKHGQEFAFQLLMWPCWTNYTIVTEVLESQSRTPEAVALSRARPQTVTHPNPN